MGKRIGFKGHIQSKDDLRFNYGIAITSMFERKLIHTSGNHAVCWI